MMDCARVKVNVSYDELPSDAEVLESPFTVSVAELAELSLYCVEDVLEWPPELLEAARVSLFISFLLFSFNLFSFSF